MKSFLLVFSCIAASAWADGGGSGIPPAGTPVLPNDEFEKVPNNCAEIMTLADCARAAAEFQADFFGQLSYTGKPAGCVWRRELPWLNMIYYNVPQDGKVYPTCGNQPPTPSIPEHQYYYDCVCKKECVAGVNGVVGVSVGETVTAGGVTLVEIPSFLQQGVVYIPQLPVTEGIVFECCKDECEVFITVYKCKGCSDGQLGGLSGFLLESGWGAGSCSPKISQHPHTHPTVSFHKTVAKGTHTIPASTPIPFFAVFVVDAVAEPWCHRPSLPMPSPGGGVPECAKHCAEW